MLALRAICEAAICSVPDRLSGRIAATVEVVGELDVVTATTARAILVDPDEAPVFALDDETVDARIEMLEVRDHLLDTLREAMLRRCQRCSVGLSQRLDHRNLDLVGDAIICELAPPSRPRRGTSRCRRRRSAMPPYPGIP
jgi:hypothetical protein